MRILVADISGIDWVRPPVAEFLGIPARQPPPETLTWKGHEVLIRPGISLEDALALKPDFVFALLGWHGIGAKRSKFYEAIFNREIPVFTWGNDSEIPKLMVDVEEKKERAVHDEHIVFTKPDHPILLGVEPEDIRRHETGHRTLVKSVRGDIGLAYDEDWECWEIIYLEEWFGNKRWLHYHPWPAPPEKLVDNMLTYMTRPKSKMPIILTVGGGLAAIGIVLLILKRR